MLEHEAVEDHNKEEWKEEQKEGRKEDRKEEKKDASLPDGQPQIDDDEDLDVTAATGKLSEQSYARTTPNISNQVRFVLRVMV